MTSWRAVEEIAKLEQRNAIKRGRFVTMFNTHAVKSLPKDEREEFFNYLKKNKRINFFIILISLSSIITSIILRPSFTGNVISLEESTVLNLSTLFVSIFLISLAIFAFTKWRKNSIRAKMKDHIRIAENVIK